MRLSIWITLTVALLVTGLALAAAWAFLRPSGPPLVSATFSLATITPNADGTTDVTRIRYTLRRPATVSIYVLNAQGERFDFRKDKPRQSGENVVDFSGIVDPYYLPGETFECEILARVLRAGAYTWVVEAVDESGERNQITGPLTVQDADTTLPLLENLSISPPVFTPNQDGLDDRVRLNINLGKDVAANGLRMYLIDANNVRLPIAEAIDQAIQLGEAGLHAYDYDGGIDLGQSPPPNGTYTVRAEAEDRLGQKTALTGMLTIQDGGLPRAEITKGEVTFSATTLLLGETLYFTLTVKNYGAAPIRTTGPASGFVYESMGANYNTAGFVEESGAYRIGIMCQTCKSDYPWRWALGTPETLTVRLDADGNPQYYLMPGESAVITGGIVLDQIVPSRRTQYFWAGLIHEDVEVTNNRVDAQAIKIEQP